MTENLNPNLYPKPSKSKIQGDRFIPSRSSTNMDLASFYISNTNSSPSRDPLFLSKLIGGGLESEKSRSPKSKNSVSRLMSYSSRRTQSFFNMPECFGGNLNYLVANRGSEPLAQKNRNIAQSAERVLDAPELRDDYYLNLMDWGENGILAIALNRSVYLWNNNNGEISTLLTTEEEDNYVCSVSWMNRQNNCLAVGLADNNINLWDAETYQPIRNLKGHSGRVSSLAWNQHILTSGSRDTFILNHDVRAKNSIVSIFENHTQEVCGLKWSSDGKTLASGGNDNLLNIWDINPMRRKFLKWSFNQHNAAVKALSWCPWQKNLLVSGGGTADKSIKFWDTEMGTMTKSQNVESQVCSLLWNPFERELLSSHGFSQNQLVLWKYPTMERITELNGHTNRVLHMCNHMDSGMVVTAAADETLRFWKIFEGTNLDERKRRKGDIFQEEVCNLR